MPAMLIGLAVLAVAAILLLGWSVPLGIGIVYLRRGTGGRGLTVFGALWGLAAIGLVALAIRAYQSARIEDFDPSAYHGQTGTIITAYKSDCSLIVSNTATGKRMRLRGADGAAVAPVGTYRIESYQAVAKDDQGDEWTASSYTAPALNQDFALAADGTHELDLGPPLTAQVMVNDDDDNGKSSFDLKIVGRGGDYALRAGGSRSHPLSFQILDQQGHELWQGNFEYG